MSPALITLFGVLFSLLANVITFVLIVCIFMYGSSKLSIHFTINLHTWMIATILDIIYLSYITIFWRGEGSIYSMTIMFWSGAFFFSVMFSSSTSVFFLTLDRCLILLTPASYTDTKRHQLAIVNVVCQIGGFLFMLLWLFPEAPALGIFKDCMSIGCAGPFIAIKITNMKLFFFALNAPSGLLFLVLLVRFNKRRSLANSNIRSANTLASYSIFSEVLLNCLPNGIGSFAFNQHGLVLSPLIGPYVCYTFSIEGLMMAFVYANVLKIQWKVAQKLRFDYHNSSTTVYVIKSTNRQTTPNTY